MNHHQNCVRNILLISNNKFISGSIDSTIKIWDYESNECLKTLTNDFEYHSLCVLSSNNYLACGCLNGTIVIWNLNNSTKVKTFKAHDDWIPCLLLTGDDQSKLISCSGEGDTRIKIWNLTTFECIKVIECHSTMILYLELNTDGILFSLSFYKTVELWQLDSGKLLQSIKFDSSINCIKILNTNLIAAASENGEIRIYDLNLNSQHVKSIIAHKSNVYRLHLLSNGNLLSSSGGEIKLWKLLE